MNILSLFDGMACGMLAMLKAEIQVDSYYAYEIDKYAVQTATHNFPQIQECGDVFEGDFSKYRHEIDLLMGGESMHLLEHCTGYRQTRNNSKWLRLGFV